MFGPRARGVDCASVPTKEPRIAGLLVSLLVLAVTGVAAWAMPRGRVSGWIGPAGAVVGCAIGFVAACPALGGGSEPSLRLPWPLPFASFSVAIDPLSAFFLLPTFAICAFAAIYGAGHTKHAGSWLWFNLLTAGMTLVIVARNAILFLMAWELMTVASFFLVTTHDERAEVRRAGRIYLVASHAGTACLLVLFLLLAGRGSLDFETFAAAPASAGAIFLLAIVGFGVKAGFIPLHIWLPEAHPAAPAHVSAVMSGIMIKLGIYGLLRTISFLGEPPLWWGWALLLIGISSGVLGVLYALAQHEIKRLLAYHSVENIGIIAMGMGLGLIGVSAHVGLLAALGFGAALLHVLNHAIFKSLLFLGAGAVIRGAGSGEIEHLGGILKRMPTTGAAFLVGAVAISGLPPLNGFVSEFLLFLGSFQASWNSRLPVGIAGVAAIAGLALIGGLAAACFAKAFGIVFLGEPRSRAAAEAREQGPLLRAPMLALAGLCAGIGLAAPWILPAPARVLQRIVPFPPGPPEADLMTARPALLGVTIAGAAFLAMVGLAIGTRRLLLRGRVVRAAGTWDCGYALSSPRLQYTASSFAQPILDLFAPMLGTRISSVKPLGLFPDRASLETATPDSFRDRVFHPLFAEMERALGRFRRIQGGRVQVYVLYIAITLVALLVYQYARNP